MPSNGQVDAGAPSPTRTAPPAGAPAAPAGTPPPFEVRGDIKGHCEKIIAGLAIAKLLPNVMSEDGGIDWDTFRQYRDEYFHNVSNVPIEPLVAEESEEDEEGF